MKIQKNKSNYLIIEQKEYEGNPYVDVRECYDNEDGERQFTKKGITFNPKLAEQVAEAVGGRTRIQIAAGKPVQKRQVFHPVPDWGAT